MCGVGVIASRHALDRDPQLRARLDGALALLGRRGPDGRRVVISDDRSTIMLHARLAVQDLSDAASQPMISADGRTRLVYNGEIYNTPELRQRLLDEGVVLTTRSDTEVLFHALLTWGTRETLERLRGMFAFVFVEGDRLVAAVDHAGMKPLAWCFDSAGDDGTLMLASECDTLNQLRGRREIDGSAIETLLSVGYVPAPRTMYRGVFKLGPGQMLEWTIGDRVGPSVSTYWRPPEETGMEVANATESLREIARQHTIGDRPMAMFLSAGIDSTALAIVLSGSAKLGALTLSPGDESDESAVAAETARRLGMSHERVPVGAADIETLLMHAAAAYDEPQGYSALFTAVGMTRAVHAQGTTRVVLGGDGGDEAFGGYAWHRDPPDHPLNLAASFKADARIDELARVVSLPEAASGDRHAALMALATRSVAHRYLVRTFGGFHPAEAAAMLGRDPMEATNAFGAWAIAEDRPKLPHPRRVQRLDLMAFCPGSVLPKLDRAAGAVGLEIRAPWLDRRVLDAWIAAPVTGDELSSAGSKPALRSIVADAVEHGRVAMEVLRRPKQGFSLRLPGEAPMEALGPIIERSALVRDGVIRRDWMRFVPPMGTPAARASRTQRLVVLGVLAAWYERRFGG